MSKFDAAIKVLRDGGWNRKLQSECNRAANVLEAAGKVDKKTARAVFHVLVNNLTTPPGAAIWTTIAEIRALLSALPPPPEGDWG